MFWDWYSITKGFNPLSFEPVLFSDITLSGYTLEDIDRITQWDDISGNDNHFTAVSGSDARPTLGNDGVVFDGVGNMLVTTADVTVRTVFAVANYNAAKFADFDGLFTHVTDNFFLIGAANGSSLYSTDFYTLYVNGVATRNFSPLPVTKILCCITTGVVSGLRGNIGRDREITERHWNGEVMHLSVFPYALSDTQRQQVEAWLANRYSISI